MTAQRHWARHLRLSQHGANFIALEEGVERFPYADSEGWATAGVGHLILPMHKGVTAEDRRKWTFPSLHAAVVYFRDHDVVSYERAVRATLGNSLITQAQFDMCVSLEFNIGTGGFANSTVAREIRAGHITAAGHAFLDWDKPSVLLGRREREMHRFLLGHW